VGENEREELAAGAVLDREADDGADEPAVEDGHRGGAEAEEDPAGDRQERHADVVHEDLARQGGLLSPGQRALAARTRLGRTLELAGDDPDRGLRIVHGPHRREHHRAEQEQERDSQRPRALEDPPPVATGDEGPQRPPGTRVGVDLAAAVEHQSLEPPRHGVAGERAPCEREIGRRGAVEPAEPAKPFGRETLRLGAGLTDERAQLFPLGLALLEETV